MRADEKKVGGRTREGSGEKNEEKKFYYKKGKKSVPRAVLFPGLHSRCARRGRKRAFSSIFFLISKMLLLSPCLFPSILRAHVALRRVASAKKKIIFFSSEKKKTQAKRFGSTRRSAGGVAGSPPLKNNFPRFSQNPPFRDTSRNVVTHLY